MIRLIYGAALLVLLSCTSKPDVALADLTGSDFMARIKESQGKKVVLANFWATWCPPCLKEFPHLVELGKQYKDQLDVVFVSFDFPERRQKAIDFLATQKLTWESYMRTGSDQEFFESFEEFSGALPFTAIFAEDGTLIKTLKGEHSKEQFESYIIEAINRKEQKQ